MATKRTSVVLNALRVTFKNLEAVPDSPEADALRLRAYACEAETQQWQSRLPSAEEREVMMKRVLAIHIELARLVRGEAASR